MFMPTALRVINGDESQPTNWQEIIGRVVHAQRRHNTTKKTTTTCSQLITLRCYFVSINRGNENMESLPATELVNLLCSLSKSEK